MRRNMAKASLEETRLSAQNGRASEEFMNLPWQEEKSCFRLLLFPDFPWQKARALQKENEGVKLPCQES
jgi:hypothetical protein